MAAEQNTITQAITQAAVLDTSMAIQAMVGRPHHTAIHIQLENRRQV